MWAFNIGPLFIGFFKKEDTVMAAIYVALLIKGKKTWAQVPDRIKDQVREMLIDLELEYLIED